MVSILWEWHHWQCVIDKTWFGVMGVPFEALIPYAIMLGVSFSDICDSPRSACWDLQMFGVTGAGLSKIRHMQNGGKRGRWAVDQWDRVCNIVLLHGTTDLWAAKYGISSPHERQLRHIDFYSDGSWQEVNWIFERSNRQCGCAGRVRAKQSMESMFAMQISDLLHYS